MRHIARALVLLLCCASGSAADQQLSRGRRLEDALRVLQRAGLPIVFSSEVVKPSMRVVVEPHATTPRQQLDELLAPHGLKAEAGPGRVILVMRDRSSAARDVLQRSRPATRTHGTEPDAIDMSQDAAKYSDTVTVWGLGDQGVDRGGSETTLGSSAVRATSTVLSSDGLDAVHAMPGVVAADDSGSEFSVRGSPARQIGIVIDGVATPWLQHTVYGRNEAGSLSMFGSDIVDRLTLQTGAYPRRYDDTLGAQLEVTLKEGSREATRLDIRAGGTSAALLGEGPVGNSGRGSWAAGVRNSYRSWPPERLSQNDVGFAFADAHAKLVYDVSPVHQVSATALVGRSTLETPDEPLVGPLSKGIDRAALVTLGWRSTLGSRTIVRQRAFFVGQELVTTLPTGQLAGRSNNRALGYRGEVLHSFAGGLLDVGAEASAMSGARHIESSDVTLLPDDFRAAWNTHAGYVNFTRAASRGLSFESGVRVSDSTLAHQRGWSPWILGSWRFSPAWTLNASAGESRQFPALEASLGRSGSSDLVPERATHLDVSIEQRRARILWQATFFNRNESDVLLRPDVQPRLVDGVLIDRSRIARYRNSLSGASRGVEFVVKPEHTARLSAWVSYTYAIARQTDTTTRETFWSDVDRRHVLNAAGVLRIARQTNAGLTLRTASGVPIPGYFEVNNGTLFVGDRRNVVRLSPYVRLDARVQRTFFSSRHAVTLFGEVLNALNRPNRGVGQGFVQPGIGDAIGFSRTLAPLKASIGIDVNLRR